MSQGSDYRIGRYCSYIQVAPKEIHLDILRRPAAPQRTGSTSLSHHVFSSPSAAGMVAVQQMSVLIHVCMHA